VVNHMVCCTHVTCYIDPLLQSEHVLLALCSADGEGQPLHRAGRSEDQGRDDRLRVVLPQIHGMYVLHTMFLYCGTQF
jgi:hypothetical protein